MINLTNIKRLIEQFKNSKSELKYKPNKEYFKIEKRFYNIDKYIFCDFIFVGKYE